MGSNHVLFRQGRLRALCLVAVRSICRCADKTVVEIRNQLTFQLITALQSPKKPSLLTGPLAYSPDRRSLACGFSGGIIIWDVQTGGVARSIDCHKDVYRLVWSLDGRTIASSLPYSNSFSGVNTYDVASGAQLFEASLEKEWVFALWAYENTFRFVSTQVPFEPDPRMAISEVGPTPTRTKIEPLPVFPKLPATIWFSSSTYRIAISGPNTLHILDARTSQSLLQENNNIQSLPSFSSDASLVAAPHQNGFRVWKYTPGSYVLLGEYLFPHIPSFSPRKLRLKISPTTTSILSRYGNVLQVWYLHGPPTTPKTHQRQHVAISRSGNHIATADKSQSTVTITDLHSQAPSQFIDTGGEIEGLAITGNVLLVAFSEKVVGWLLTEEGRVAGVVGNGRASHSDSIWTVTSPLQHPKSLCFRVSGQVSLIGTDDILPFSYHTGTGGAPDNVHQPQYFGFPWVSMIYELGNYQEYHYLRHHDTPQRDTPPEDGWLILGTTAGKAGWVVDSDGRHRFWVPAEWKRDLDRKNWHHDIMTLFIGTEDEPVVIKF